MTFARLSSDMHELTLEAGDTISHSTRDQGRKNTMQTLKIHTVDLTQSTRTLDRLHLLTYEPLLRNGSPAPSSAGVNASQQKQQAFARSSTRRTRTGHWRRCDADAVPLGLRRCSRCAPLIKSRPLVSQMRCQPCQRSADLESGDFGPKKERIDRAVGHCGFRID